MDIPDIDRVVQFMLPKALSEWIQHFGRAGRAGQPSEAILLVEPSVFAIKNASKSLSEDEWNNETATCDEANPVQEDVDGMDVDTPWDQESDADPLDNEVDIQFEDILADHEDGVDVFWPNRHEDQISAGDEDSEVAGLALTALDTLDTNHSQPMDVDLEDALPANNLNTEGPVEVDSPSTTIQYVKTVNPAFRAYLDTTVCRRAAVNIYFGNPPLIRGNIHDILYHSLY